MESLRNPGRRKENYELIKNGFLDVKYPPGKQDRKFGKIWHRRWIEIFVSRDGQFSNALRLEFHVLKPVRKVDNSSVPFIEFRHVRFLFRSWSKSRPHKSFGIATFEKEFKVMLYLAAEDERQTQLWMKMLRDALFPPRPFIHAGEANTKRHYVSIIDNKHGFQKGLIGCYGHLLISNTALTIHNAQDLQVIVQWPIKTLREAKMCRFDYENSESGVFSVSFRFGNKNEGQKLTMCFYSPSAQVVIKDIDEILIRSNLKPDSHKKQKSPSKETKNCKVQDVTENLTNKKNNTIPNIPHHDPFPSTANSIESTDSAVNLLSSESVSIGPTLRKLGNLPSSALNTSISSALSSKSAELSSDSDDDLAIPNDFLGSETPIMLRRNNCSEIENRYQQSFNSQPSDFNEKDVADIAQVETKDTDQLILRSCTEAIDVHQVEIQDDYYANQYDGRSSTRMQSVMSDDHIYSDIPHAEERGYRDSIDAGTVYEELGVLDDDSVIDELKIPPIPPPRRPRRPTTLALQELSFNIETALEDAQCPTSTSSPISLQKSSRSWLKTIKGMKRIFSKERISKSCKPSPTTEQSDTVKVKSKVKRVASAPMFIPEKPSPIELSNDMIHHSASSGSPISFFPKSFHENEDRYDTDPNAPPCDSRTTITLHRNDESVASPKREILLRSNNENCGIAERRSLPVDTGFMLEAVNLRFRSKSLTLKIEASPDDKDDNYLKSHMTNKSISNNYPTSDQISITNYVAYRKRAASL